MAPADSTSPEPSSGLPHANTYCSRSDEGCIDSQSGILYTQDIIHPPPTPRHGLRKGHRLMLGIHNSISTCPSSCTSCRNCSRVSREQRWAKVQRSRQRRGPPLLTVVCCAVKSPTVVTPLTSGTLPTSNPSIPFLTAGLSPRTDFFPAVCLRHFLSCQLESTLSRPLTLPTSCTREADGSS